MTAILHKRKAATPTASDLTVGELAINTSNGKVFTKTSGGSVVEIAGGSGGGVSSDSNWNTVGGTDAGSALNADDYANTLYGYEAGKNVDALANTLIGYQAGEDMTSGEHNVGLGSRPLSDVTTGSYNIGIGTSAVGDVTTQEGNVGIGYAALTNTEADKNVGVGFRAAEGTTTGAGITALGNYSLYTNTTGSNNTAIGNQSLQICTGSENTALGSGAGYANGSYDPTSGSNNTFIGYQALPSSATVSNEVTIGNSSVTKFRVPGTNLYSESGVLDIKNSGTASEMRLYCESNNAHYASLKAPAHSSFSGNLTYTLPSGYGSNGQVLSSNGSGGTSWVAQSGGTTYTASTGLNLNGTAFSIAYGGASSNAVRKVTTSTSAPSGGSDGDIWIKYTN